MGYAVARLNMVRSQVQTNKVTDERLIAALEAVPRELFVPEALKGIAYVDEDIPLGNGRCVMEPAVLARLIQAAAAGPGDVALVVGCATGYSVAVLARLVNTVVALECDTDLAAQATRILRELAVDNAVVLDGRLEIGCPRQGPYDIILLDGAVDSVPSGLTDQLAEGGRLVGVIGGRRPGCATLMTRVGGVVSSRALFDASVGALPGFAIEPGFVF